MLALFVNCEMGPPPPVFAPKNAWTCTASCPLPLPEALDVWKLPAASVNPIGADSR
jgi:hypothetical protein